MHKGTWIIPDMIVGIDKLPIDILRGSFISYPTGGIK